MFGELSATFLGIDLGWQSQPSGLCCLQWHNDRLHLIALDRQDSLSNILTWIQTWATSTTIVAVDAPTVIPNLSGMRLCDRLSHRYFGKYHAGCYPANQSRPFAQRTVAFGDALVEQGFAHAPQIMPHSSGRYQIEVFPHPATIHLFQLDRILKYKKGRLADRQQALSQLRGYIQEVLPKLEPPLAFDQPLPAIPRTGADLKNLEDRLDSLICAYVAAHWWYWGSDRNWTLGNLAEGYIIIPAPSHTNTLQQF